MKNLVKVAVVAAGLFFTVNTVNAQQKFGHINSEELLKVMPEIKVADANFETFRKQKQTALEQMGAEHTKKTLAAQELYKTLSEANKDAVNKELQTRSNEIADLEKRITDAQQKAEADLTTKRNELYQPVFDKAETAVKAVAKEKGYSYVFDVSQPGVVYFDGGDDIINAVKTKLGISASSTTATTAKKP